ncbi:MAG TPA: HDOD domain-containing protein [Candidatus Hydrogenedentes bacterium]|nr:HDOD domain-containing protein [Candidatus Hydrogenedentota bacterium]
MNTRERIIEHIRKMPALPAAAGRVLTAARDPDAGIADIMKIIEADAGLTADILRLANSAFFAGPRKIGNLRDAGVLLGMNRIVELVLSSAIVPLAKGPVPGYDLSEGKLLEHMFATGIGTEELARALGFPPPLNAFTAGLLHGVGKIALGQVVADQVEEIKKQVTIHQIPFDKAEERVLGISYPEAGAILLEYWNLPEELCQAVRWHREPDKAAGNKLMCDLVHAASVIALECGLGLGEDGLLYTVCPGTVERLRIREEVVEKTGAAIIEKLDDLRQVFGLAARRT